MSSLDNIPKKSVFRVPEGYFDQLPAVIQSRVQAQGTCAAFSPAVRYGFQYALPLLILVAAVLFFTPSSGPDAESILAQVETADLLLYADELSAITSEDLLETFYISTDELEAIENEAYDLSLEGTADEILELELNNL